ncbi:2TM domain-containing protein [Vibrio gazogenes]|uniref:Helix-turn-helix n=1 Tax=Vibrio gazogenes DSM 21264 = NBRC 103151 TaxID=1123492 RepID=A0A1M5FHQ8_VIBGA|nr:2TM domain-containing protein [Vibrio gazogenes]USP14441.1 2TM domain-containing protein [Vibrio gazogenes]SHF91035.1 Helix-turn-helix [Vibrio gazogenes DSM 21264] [Vibrio gazogenes DSM 21264 = NBRC 103151]SJN52836.1 DNA-binding transcriptional repressor PuuR [Vibrio gazogenes]
MNIRKRRLQKGWSQEQLAQLSGLNIRTVQRIERGQKPSLESLNALAAVFEIDLSELQGEQEMNKNNQTNQISEEERAINYVRDIKGFYSHVITYTLVISLLFIINFVTDSSYIWAWWPMLGWGIGLISHGLNVFEVFNFFGPKWERKQIEKRLGRKL